MSEKSFGVNNLDIFDDSIRSVNSDGSLNIEANTLGISTHLNVGGIVTAIGGFNLGIHSSGTQINTGVITAINFVGSGNTLSYNSGTKTVNVSISGGEKWIYITDDYTASSGEHIIADTIGDESQTSNPFTITFPSNPNFGDTITIADGNDWSSANLTITSSDKIEKSSSDLVFDTKDIILKFVYQDSFIGWHRYTQIGGSQGVQGTQGSQGFQGTQGTQGIQGSQGFQGTQGLSNQGAQGTQGSQGFQGLFCAVGNQGNQGTQGSQGSQGFQGLFGGTGLQGAQGSQGFQGIQGLSNQGAQGTQGLQGSTATQFDGGVERTVTSVIVGSASTDTIDVNYTVGYLDVYLNGSKLDNSEYTATNGTSVIFIEDLIENDIIETISYERVSLGQIQANSKTAIYQLVLTDVGKFVNTDSNVKVPSNIFSEGDIISVYNNSSSSIVIQQNAGTTVYLGGVGSTGNRTLEQKGVATLLCVGSNLFVITGAGLL